MTATSRRARALRCTERVDQLLKFSFAAPVRGECVQLASAWQRIVQHHSYPKPVARLLGEMTAAAALLASNIKFDGTLILQIYGDGPVKLLVVECQSDLRLRATAKLRSEAAIHPGAGLRELVNARGAGRCAITLDPRARHPGQRPYQGVVPLDGDSIAQVLESYMRTSEQLETRFWLAAADDVCAGMLLQKLPGQGGKLVDTDEDAWPRVVTLASTLESKELLGLPPAEQIRRLFWQEPVALGTPLAPRFECSCSRQRIGRMLLSLGRAEVDDILAELGAVSVTCDFCNAAHSFDAVDIGELFATGQTVGAGVNPAQ